MNGCDDKDGDLMMNGSNREGAFCAEGATLFCDGGERYKVRSQRVDHGSIAGPEWISATRLRKE